MEIREIAEKGAHFLTIKSMDGDIRIESRRKLEIKIEKNKVRKTISGERAALGVRAISGKKLGFATSISFPDDISRVVEKAILSARFGQPDPFLTLPSDPSVSHVTGICNKNLAAVSVTELSELAKQLIWGVEERGAQIDLGILKVDVFKFHVANTEGISKGYEETIFSLHLSCIRENNEAFDYIISRELPQNFMKIGEECARKITTQLKKCSLQKELLKKKVILASSIASEILFFPLAFAVYAPGVGTVKVGDMIGRETLNIIDDGTLRGGIRSSPIDGEGNPSMKTPVVTSGVVKNLLHTEYTANMMKTSPTGNAKIESTSLPRPIQTNFIVKKTSKETLRDKGIFVERFLGDVDLFNGNFSGRVEKATFVRNEEALYELRPFNIAGNSFSCFRYVEELGNEKKPDIKGIYSPVAVLKGYEFGT
jgi:PmbA protein